MISAKPDITDVHFGVRDRLKLLGRVVDYTLYRMGKGLVPAAALSKTQHTLMTNQARTVFC